MNSNTVTIEQVRENMRDVVVRTIQDFDKPCTYVTVRMKNGFTLRESTTCVDPANYDEEIGKQICLKKIEDKIWFLLGYELQDRLYREQIRNFKPTVEELKKLRNAINLCDSLNEHGDAKVLEDLFGRLALLKEM